MNVLPIVNALIASIPDADSETLMIMSKIIKRLSLGQVHYTINFIDLPDATLNEGSIHYVETDEMVYQSNGIEWIEFTP